MRKDGENYYGEEEKKDVITPHNRSKIPPVKN